MLSVVVPCFNEELTIPALARALRPVLDGLGESYEVVLVDDGSTDGSVDLLAGLAATWPELRVVELSSNRGQQAAIVAGLEHALGTFVVTMDADLQDPPSLIPQLVDAARANAVDVVYARRTDRSADSVFKRISARVYYWLVALALGAPVVSNAADFRLMSRRAVAGVLGSPVQPVIPRVVVPWLRLPAATVEYAHDVRCAGTTHYTVGRMLHLTFSSLRVAARLRRRVEQQVEHAGQ